MRVRNYHQQLIENVSDMLGAMGLSHPGHLRPWHIRRRVSATEVKQYAEIYDFLQPGELLESPLPETFSDPCTAASVDTFERVVVP